MEVLESMKDEIEKTRGKERATTILIVAFVVFVSVGLLSLFLALVYEENNEGNLIADGEYYFDMMGKYKTTETYTGSW